MTVVHHGGWQRLRDEALRRNAAVARGEPDDFEPLPQGAHPGEVARREKAARRREAPTGDHVTRDDGRRVTLVDLVDAGVLAAGTAVWAQSAGQRYLGCIDDRGRIVLSDGRVADSPSAVQKLATGKAKNGWRGGGPTATAAPAGSRTCGPSSWTGGASRRHPSRS